MITREDIQSFLDRLEGGSLAVREVEPNLWLTRTADDAEVVIHYAVSYTHLTLPTKRIV